MNALYRIVQVTNGVEDVSGMILTADEVPAALGLEVLLHRNAGFDVELGGGIIVVTAEEWARIIYAKAYRPDMDGEPLTEREGSHAG